MPTHHVATGALISAQASLTIGAPALQLLDRAESLLAGLHALAKADPATAQAATFLGSWSLELLLKAHLARAGKTKKSLRQIQHNLDALWELAASTGLPVTPTPPEWCKVLNRTHDHPYVQRYDADVAAWVSPNIPRLLEELVALQKAVRSSVR